MATMSVSLPDDLADFIREETIDGGYENQSDVFRAGLRSLMLQKQKRIVLRRLLAEGAEDIAAGRVQPLTDELLIDVTDRARARAGRKDR